MSEIGKFSPRDHAKRSVRDRHLQIRIRAVDVRPGAQDLVAPRTLDRDQLALLSVNRACSHRGSCRVEILRKHKQPEVRTAFGECGAYFFHLRVKNSDPADVSPKT